MTLEEKKNQIVEELSFIEDPHERLAYIIDRARGHPGLDDAYKVDTFKIEGCQSALWLYPSFQEDHCHFQADSDAVITKGIAGLLTELYDGATPEEILATPPDFLADVGVTQHLTPNRRNGLTNLWQRIQGYAELCLNGQQAQA